MGFLDQAKDAKFQRKTDEVYVNEQIQSKNLQT